MLANFAGVLFDGIAYGSLLFLISVGLSVTMGMMNFINLAHGAFAMLGGYVSVTLLSRFGVPFWRRCRWPSSLRRWWGCCWSGCCIAACKASHLDQVLFSIGLTFMAVAGATYFYGPTQQPVVLPDRLRGQVSLLGLDVGAYRLFLIGVVVLVTVALGLLIERTRFGAQIRASVDNQTAAAGLGINVSLVFSLTFALGSGLAGLGGGLASTCWASIRPSRSSTWSTSCSWWQWAAPAPSRALLAAAILGVFDVAGKYYVPEVGAFVIYALMVVLLILFPAGLMRRKA
jgi:branched-chain amino acid transport system permease protein